MVLGVCRQILRHRHDADDAFQATFLVLVRKARSIRVGESLAPWLCGVAYRTAQRVRQCWRYRTVAFEQLADPSRSAPDDAYHFDLRPLLHEELDRLPGKFRDVIVLCHLEGKSHEEAARQLRWPVGTVSSRLSRGRQLLRSRLVRRGLAVSPALVATHWLAGTTTTVALPLVKQTVAAAISSATTPAVSALVLSLTQGVSRTMLLNKLKTISVAFLLIGASTGGIGVWAHWSSRPKGHSATESALVPTQAPEKAGNPAKDTGVKPQPEQPPASSQSGGVNTELADRDVPSTDDEPTCCPIAMATHAVQRLLAHIHQSWDSSW